MRNHHHTILGGLAIAAAIFAASPAQADVLVAYDFESSENPGTAHPLVDATPIAAGAGLIDSTIGSGYASSSNNFFVREHVTAASEADAVADDDYLTFTVTPDAGQKISLSSLTFRVGIQTTVDNSTSNLFLRTSLDGFASTVDSIHVTASSNDTAANDASADFALSGESEAPITFRLYLWDDSDSTQRIVRIDNIVLNGSLSPIPEPASLTLLAIGGAMLATRRRSPQR